MKIILYYSFFFFVLSLSRTYANTLFNYNEQIYSSQKKIFGKRSFSVNLGLELTNLDKLKTFNIELPGGVDIKVIRTSIEFRSNKKFYFLGDVENDPYGSVSFVFTQNSISGSIKAGGKSYRILRKNEDYFFVEIKSFLDKKKLISDAVYKERNLDSENFSVVGKSSDHFIDLMLVYTAVMFAADNDIESGLQANVLEINSILEKSCINYRYRLVHMEKVTYTRDTSMTVDLDKITDGDAPFAGIAALRATHGADLIQLLVATNASSCGLGWVGVNPSPGIGFSVSAYDCGAETMAHELGHNIGLTHDRYQKKIGMQTENAQFKDAYGFVDLVNKTISIMAYPVQCSDNGITCVSAGKFSNPKIFHKGIKFGLDGYINASKASTEKFAYIADYVASKTSYSPKIKNFCRSKSNDPKEEADIHCFIATAAHGSYMHPQVLKLREFRDAILKTNFLGQKFIKYYYKISPTFAYMVSKNLTLKKLAKGFIYSLVFIIDYGVLILLVLLSLIIIFILRKKNTQFFGTTSVIFLIFLVSLHSKNLSASVSYPSYFKTDLGINPATRLLISSPLLYGLGLETKKRTIESNSDYYKEKTSQKSLALLGGFYAPLLFAELKMNIIGGSETDITSKGMESSTSETEFTQLQTNFGTSLLFFPIGIRVNKRSSEHKKTKNKVERLDIGVGSYMNLFGLQLGFGFNYITEKGNNLTESKWIESYIGLGMGSLLTAGKFHGEIYLLRRPEVFNYEGDNFNFHASKLVIGLNAELAGLTFPLINKAGINIEQSTESKTDYYLDEDISKTRLALSVLGPLSTTGFEWSSELSIKSLSSENSDSEVGINVYLVYSI